MLRESLTIFARLTKREVCIQKSLYVSLGRLIFSVSDSLADEYC